MNHGTHAGYSRGCRCAACTDGHRVYQANFDRQRLYGTWVPYADDPLESEETMAELLEHLAALRSAGVGRRTICKATGVGSGTLWKITSGETKRVHRSTAAALFALTTNVLAPGAVIDGTETHRLIAELVAAGMQKRRIARCLGWGDSIQLKARVEAKNAPREGLPRRPVADVAGAPRGLHLLRAHPVRGSARSRPPRQAKEPSRMTAHCQDCTEEFTGFFWCLKAAWHWIRFNGQDVT